MDTMKCYHVFVQCSNCGFEDDFVTCDDFIKPGGVIDFFCGVCKERHDHDIVDVCEDVYEP